MIVQTVKFTNALSDAEIQQVIFETVLTLRP